MFKTLRSRIWLVVSGLLFLTLLTVMTFVQRQTEQVLFAGGENSARNLLHTVALNVENEYRSLLFYKAGALEKRKSELKNIATLALTYIHGCYEKQENGILSEKEAQQIAAEEIKRLRYDNGIGYIWINDTGRPVPRMIMHPTIPTLDGEVLDDPEFDCAFNVKKNLFQACVDVCLNTGEGYVDYLWPKPGRDGLSPDQPKLSYVCLFKAWDWIVGTGLYTDDIEQDAQRRRDAVISELKDTFSKVRIVENGYLFLFNSDHEMLIHPSIEGLDISKTVNPLTGNLLLNDFITAAETPEKPLEYIWDKPPAHTGEFRFGKRAFVNHFKPLDWYIVSSVYNDELKLPGKKVREDIILLSLVFFFVALIVSTFLSKNLTTPLRRLTAAARQIEARGPFSGGIPISGTVETRELGSILERTIHSIRRAENELRQSEEKYRKLIETSPDGIAICALNSRFLEANQALQEMLGYTMAELKGMPYTRVVKPQWEEKKADLMPFMEDTGQFGPLELVCLAKEGTEVPVIATSWLIRDSRGIPEKLVIFVKDITDQKKEREERKTLQARLQQAQKMEAIGTLAGGIAHDFNNILGVIIGYTELIELFDVPEDSPSRSRLDEIIKAAQRATELVQQILTFSRQTEHTMRPMRLGPLVKETLKFLRASLPATIEIRQRIDGTGTVLADPTHVHQILMNLCVNAGHAMGVSGGVLKVTMEDVYLGAQEAVPHVDLGPGPYVRLEVRDTGHGMSRDMMERIFDPYFTTKKKGDGTGLGLSVVHGIVKTCGGVITVDSELGAGTTFEVFLPQFGDEAVDSDGRPAPPMASGSERILFVDDEKPLVEIAGTILGGLGYETVGTSGGNEALEVFRVEPDRFDLVITDQTMPKMTGMALAREVIQIRPDIPVILCSGFSETVTSDRARAVGIRAVIRKPLIAAALAENIRNVLDQGNGDDYGKCSDY